MTDLHRWAERAARQAGPRQRRRPSHRLPAEALDGVRPVPGRWADLRQQQRRGTGSAGYRPWAQVMAVLRLGPGRAARRGDVQPDRHGQDEQRRSASLARRRAGPHCRPISSAPRRSAALELDCNQSRRRQPGYLNPRQPNPGNTAVHAECLRSHSHPAARPDTPPPAAGA